MEESKMSTEIDTNIDNIPNIEAGSGVDLTEFSGQKMKVAGIKVLEVESNFDEQGNYNEKAKRKVQVLKVYTDAVTTLINKEGKEVPVTASELFNLKQNSEGKWGASLSEKSKLRKFLKRQKVTKVKELIGTTVIIKDYQDKKSGQTYLGFVFE
jgi:hypothetical protein